MKFKGKHFVRIGIIFLFLLFVSSVSFGQKIIHYNIKSGLPNLTCFNLLQDKDGLLWIASQGGIVVFNGINFESVGFGKNKGTKGIIVQKMVPTKKDSYYTFSAEIRGTEFYGHVQNYFPKTNIAKNIIKDIPIVTTDRAREYIRDLFCDSKNNLWILTSGGTVIKYDDAKKSIDTLNFTSDSIYLNEDSDYFRFINESNGIINFYNTKGIFQINERGKVKFLFALNNENIAGAFYHNSQTLICGSNGNLYKYDGNENLQKLDSGFNVFTPVVFSSAFDGENLALGTYYGLLEYNLKTKERTLYKHDSNDLNSLPSNGVNDCLYDKDKNIWVGFGAAGIACIKKKNVKFHHIEIKDEAGKISVFDGLKIKDNWILATSKGLIKYNEKDKTQIILKDFEKQQFLLEGEFLTSRIFKDLKGNIWYGRLNGVYVFDGNNFEPIKTIETPFGIIKDFLQLNEKEIWFSVLSSGIIKYDIESGEQRLYNYGNGLPEIQNYVFSMKNFGERIFAGTNTQGIIEYNAKKDIFEKMSFKENTTSLDIEVINEYLWLGTYSNQIIKYNLKSGKEVNVFEINRSRAHTVHQMEYDGKNSIWFTSLKGLGNFNLKSNSYRWFGDNDEIPFDELNPSYKIKKINSDLMFMGQPEGFVIWSDSIIEKSKFVPKLVLTQINIKGRAVDENKILSIPINDRSIELNYDENSFEIFYSGIDLMNGKKIVYRYQLVNRDHEWIELDNLNHINFLDISPGNYELKIEASIDSINWSKPLILDIKINFPWWESTWFRLIIVISFLILVYFIYLWRTKALRNRQKQLEDTVMERTSELNHEKELVEEKQKEIIDSINYAKRLQHAILSPESEIKKYLPNSFLYYKPKDIVAGDFYFFEVVNNCIFYAAADCTGHGVPGAMVSIVCSNALTRCVKEFKLTDPGKILDKTRELILETFQKSGEDVKDGMDISFCKFEISNNKITNIEWAGANNPLWYMVNGEMIEIKADKQPIGKVDNPKLFTTHLLDISNTTIFLFTDGYADQFGGPKGKKFKYSSLQKLLLEMQSEKPKTQNLKLETAFDNWKGDLEQVDDVCIIGIRI